MRIFLLGDSFTDNIFKEAIYKLDNNIESGDGIYRYVKLLREKKIKDPLHWGDYLESWGYEIVNLGENGCSNYSIFNQFPRIDTNYNESDRIILNWTGLNRFNWIGKRGNNMVITGGSQPDYDTNLKTKILCDQSVYRMESLNDEHGYLRRSTVPFMNYLIGMHNKYKPIVWTPIAQHNVIFEREKYFIWEIDNDFYKNITPDYNILTIENETNGKVLDKHYGRYGNFYMALVFDTILKHTQNTNHSGLYIKDYHLMDKIKETIKNSKHNLDKLNKLI
jgi:hypothetical protein